MVAGKTDLDTKPSSPAFEGRDETLSLPKLDIKTQDRQTQDMYNRLKQKSEKNSTRILNLLNKAKKNDSRANGIGAFGGPIARMVKSPGQHNGLNYTPTDIKGPQLQLTQAQMNEIMKEHGDVYLPEWDRNHTVAGVLSGDIPRIKEDRDKVFRMEIQKFRSQDLSMQMSESIYSFSKYENLGSHTSSNLHSKTEQSQISEAATKWSNLVNEMHSKTSKLTYKDLVDISCLREPPQFIENLVSYIGILLGLKPSWKAAKRSLFHEIFSLQVFFATVEPLSIPVKRIEKAIKLKEDTMRNLSEDTSPNVYAPSSFPALASWVLCFDKLGRIMVKVDKRLVHLNTLHHEHLPTQPISPRNEEDDGDFNSPSVMKLDQVSAADSVSQILTPKKLKTSQVINGDKNTELFFEQLMIDDSLYDEQNEKKCVQEINVMSLPNIEEEKNPENDNNSAQISHQDQGDINNDKPSHVSKRKLSISNIMGVESIKFTATLNSYDNDEFDDEEYESEDFDEADDDNEKKEEEKQRNKHLHDGRYHSELNYPTDHDYDFSPKKTSIESSGAYGHHKVSKPDSSSLMITYSFDLEKKASDEHHDHKILKYDKNYNLIVDDKDKFVPHPERHGPKYHYRQRQADELKRKNNHSPDNMDEIHHEKAATSHGNGSTEDVHRNESKDQLVATKQSFEDAYTTSEVEEEKFEQQETKQSGEDAYTTSEAKEEKFEQEEALYEFDDFEDEIIETPRIDMSIMSSPPSPSMKSTTDFAEQFVNVAISSVVRTHNSPSIERHFNLKDFINDLVIEAIFSAVLDHKSVD